MAGCTVKERNLFLKSVGVLFTFFSLFPTDHTDTHKSTNRTGRRLTRRDRFVKLLPGGAIGRRLLLNGGAAAAARLERNTCSAEESTTKELGTIDHAFLQDNSNNNSAVKGSCMEWGGRFK